MRNNISPKSVLYFLLVLAVVVGPMIISSYLNSISGIPDHQIYPELRGSIMNVGVTNKLAGTELAYNNAMDFSPKLKFFKPTDPVIIWFGVKRTANDIHKNVEFALQWVMPNGQTRNLSFLSKNDWSYFELPRDKNLLPVGSHHVIVRRLDINKDLFKINFNVKEAE